MGWVYGHLGKKVRMMIHLYCLDKPKNFGYTFIKKEIKTRHFHKNRQTSIKEHFFPSLSMFFLYFLPAVVRNLMKANFFSSRISIRAQAFTILSYLSFLTTEFVICLYFTLGFFTSI